MKHRFLSAVLAAAMALTISIPAVSASEPQEMQLHTTEPQSVSQPLARASYDSEAVYNAMIALQDEYPTGMEWTNDNYYEWNGGIYAGGYGCAGFAFMLSDAAFGTLPARMTQTFDPASIRVGDILRYSSHSFIVLEVKEDSFIAAEGNINSSIMWGREITFAEMESTFEHHLTRYPEEETTTPPETTTEPITTTTTEPEYIYTTTEELNSLYVSIDPNPVSVGETGTIYMRAYYGTVDSYRIEDESIARITVDDDDTTIVDLEFMGVSAGTTRLIVERSGEVFYYPIEVLPTEETTAETTTTETTTETEDQPIYTTTEELNSLYVSIDPNPVYVGQTGTIYMRAYYGTVDSYRIEDESIARITAADTDTKIVDLEFMGVSAGTTRLIVERSGEVFYYPIEVLLPETTTVYTENGIATETTTTETTEPTTEEPSDAQFYVRLEVSGEPDKTEYLIGEELDLTGLTINTWFTECCVWIEWLTDAYVTDFTNTEEEYIEVTGYEPYTTGEQEISVTLYVYNNVLDTWVSSTDYFYVTVLAEGTVPDAGLGDANQDGTVNASDAAELLTAAANLGSTGESGLTAEQEQDADVNGSGAFDASDAALILSYAAYCGTDGTMIFPQYLEILK